MIYTAGLRMRGTCLFVYAGEVVVDRGEGRGNGVLGLSVLSELREKKFCSLSMLGR